MSKSKNDHLMRHIVNINIKNLVHRHVCLPLGASRATATENYITHKIIYFWNQATATNKIDDGRAKGEAYWRQNKYQGPGPRRMNDYTTHKVIIFAYNFRFNYFLCALPVVSNHSRYTYNIHIRRHRAAHQYDGEHVPHPLYIIYNRRNTGAVPCHALPCIQPKILFFFHTSLSRLIFC